VLYVNGRYEPNGHFVNYLGTAPIKDLRYESFTVGLDFYPLPKKRSRYSFNRLEAKLDSWTRGRYARWRGIDANLYNTDNILTGGYSYRWIGFNREDGLLNLTLNNQSFAHRFKDVAVKPGRWHNLICSVDLQRRKILTMFDGHPLEAITLPSDFKLEVAGGPGDTTEREFTFDNHSNGSVFFGYAAHLKILGRALAESEVASLYNESLSEHPKFPRRHFLWPAVVLILVVATLVVSLFLWLRIRRYRPGDSQIPKPPWPRGESQTRITEPNAPGDAVCAFLFFLARSPVAPDLVVGRDPYEASFMHDSYRSDVQAGQRGREGDRRAQVRLHHN